MKYLATNFLIARFDVIAAVLMKGKPSRSGMTNFNTRGPHNPLGHALGPHFCILILKGELNSL
jgi:hypothetical protein